MSSRIIALSFKSVVSIQFKGNNIANKTDKIKSFKQLEVDNCIKFIEIKSETNLQEILHEIKRNQLFNISNPSEFEKKILFLQKFNSELQDIEVFSEFKLYFEYLENIYSLMNDFYIRFDTFYKKLEKIQKTDLFVNYLFQYYTYLTIKILHFVKNTRSSNNLLNMTSTPVMPNSENNSIDIDQQVEFIAEFVQTNINFFKFKSKVEEIQIIPHIDNSNMDSILKEFFENDKYSILESFSIWKNGIECIDLLNLFDWNISKYTHGNKIEYLIKPQKDKMNTFVNKEFGYYLYQNLKHATTSIKYTSKAISLVKDKKMHELIELEFEYIKDIFTNQYYIESKIFNQKINNFSLESYIKFYLIYRNFYFYFYDKKDDTPIFLIPWEQILKLFTVNLYVFKNILNLDNQKEIQNFFETALEFFTNNGNDLFNYPFFKYDFMTYAIPNTIINASISRLFVERFDDIISKFSEKGKTLEEKLLPSEEVLQFRNIEMRKNIKLKKGNTTIGEIDLVLFDGNTLILAELKNQKIYYGYKEMYRRKKDLKHASMQLNRIIKYLHANNQKSSKRLGINLNLVKNIIPIIITPLDELNNQKVDNCLIVNSLLVKSYFEYDHFAMREYGMNTNIVVKRMYFNTQEIKLKEFIDFIQKNKSIKILNFFKDKKIGNSTIFREENFIFSRTLLKVKNANKTE